MVICPDCGKDVREAKFCSNCGARLPEVGEVNVEVHEEPVVEDQPVIEEPIIEDGPVVEDEPVIEEPIIEEEPVVEEEVIETNIVKKTKFCTNCGAEVTLETVFCPNCGFKLVQEEEPQTKFCQSCGKKININAEICPYCGVRVANITKTEEKNVLLSAILSFLFPGLGHLYLGLTKKGISFIIAYIISAILVWILIGFVLIFIIWIWALIDSIKSTEAINKGEFVKDELF